MKIAVEMTKLNLGILPCWLYIFSDNRADARKEDWRRGAAGMCAEKKETGRILHGRGRNDMINGKSEDLERNDEETGCWNSGPRKRGINLSNTFIAAGKSAQTTDMKGFLKNGT